MAMSAGGGGGGVQSSPNVTPMVDVMLVLLIIFMVVTPALLAGFNAEPPQAVNIKDHPEDDQTDQVLGIDKDGGYHMNKKDIQYADIPAYLKRVYVDTPRDDYILYLKADKGTEYSKVLDLLDVATKNGVKVVAMIGDQKPNTISTVPGDTKQPAPAPAGGAK